MRSRDSNFQMITTETGEQVPILVSEEAQAGNKAYNVHVSRPL
jgi:hypothetical protein